MEIEPSGAGSVDIPPLSASAIHLCKVIRDQKQTNDQYAVRSTVSVQNNEKGTGRIGPRCPAIGLCEPSHPTATEHAENVDLDSCIAPQISSVTDIFRRENCLSNAHDNLLLLI